MESTLTDIVSGLADVVAAWGLTLLGALVLLVVGWWVAKLLRRTIRKGLKRSGADATLIPFIANLAYAALLTALFITVAGTVGIPMGSFVAIVGAAGLAVALAFQGTMSHFASGVMLLTFRPFKVGDFVDAGGTSGTVSEVGIFQTVLTTPDNLRIIVPNSKISGDTIKNYSANETRRIDLVIGVDYGDDLELAKEAILEILSREDRILEDPAPVVEVHELGASSVDFVVRPWVKTPDYWATRWALTKALKEGIEDAGLSFPFPQRDVHLFRENAE